MNARWMGTLVLVSVLAVAPNRVQIEAGESATESPPGRIYVSLDEDWRFFRGDAVTGMSPRFNDDGWQKVDVPHDWSSAGPFGAEYGSGNGYAPGGIGCYRKRFRLDEDLKDKAVAVEFDGVYDRSQVWINGHYVGGRPYGYSSFGCPLTPLLRFGTEENVLAVRVDHSRFSDSRWYTGSGIYRHVRLRVTDKLRIGYWGTFVTTPEVGEASAVVQVETTVENSSGQSRAFSLQSEVLEPDQKVAGVALTPGTAAEGTNLTLVQKITVPHPRLWSVIDMQDLVRRDRNHPSVILWSIGNEIDYPNDPFSHPVLGNNYRPANPPAEDLVTCARPLIAAVKALDPTRPVTAALANVAMSDAVGLGALLDVVGYNYQESRYAADQRKYPQRFIFGSENGGQPANWAVVRTNDYVAGQFLWTGIDYLGEANRWPNRGSGAGLLDLCGFKKPFAWLRQSLWTEEPMVYLCAMTRGRPRGPGGRRLGFGAQEHWNWSTNDEVMVFCYSTCPEVTLTLNEQPLGTKRLAESMDGSSLFWQVRFEPGVLRAVATKDGKTACECLLTTADAPSRIQLLPEEATLRADGQDVGHVEFRIVDARGVRVPDAENELTFRVQGPARIIGLENGDLKSPETGKNGVRQAHRGRGLALVQTTREPGTIRLSANADGLPEASVEMEALP